MDALKLVAGGVPGSAEVAGGWFPDCQGEHHHRQADQPHQGAQGAEQEQGKKF